EQVELRAAELPGKRESLESMMRRREDRDRLLGRQLRRRNLRPPGPDSYELMLGTQPSNSSRELRRVARNAAEGVVRQAGVDADADGGLLSSVGHSMIPTRRAYLTSAAVAGWRLRAARGCALCA